MFFLCIFFISSLSINWQDPSYHLLFSLTLIIASHLPLSSDFIHFGPCWHAVSKAGANETPFFIDEHNDSLAVTVFNQRASDLKKKSLSGLVLLHDKKETGV